MGERNLVQQIVSLLEVASRPLTAGDIRRRLDGLVDASEISSRLVKLKKRGVVSGVLVESSALSGPRKVNAYTLARDSLDLEYIPTIAKTRENCDFSHRQVASTQNVLLEVN